MVLRPRFQIVKPISYGSCPSIDCNFFKYLSLASLGCRMSKYLDKKKTLDKFLDGSAAISFVETVKTTGGCTLVRALQLLPRTAETILEMMTFELAKRVTDTFRKKQRGPIYNGSMAWLHSWQFWSVIYHVKYMRGALDWITSATPFSRHKRLWL